MPSGPCSHRIGSTVPGATALYLQGKLDEAIKAYDEAIRINPLDAEAWDGRGNALGDQGKYDEAIKAYDEAIRLEPNNAVVWSNKGATLKDQAEYLKDQG